MTNTTDDINVVGSLRWAVDQANQTTGNDTIQFQDNLGRIDLNVGSLFIIETTGSLTIDGPESGLQIISRSQADGTPEFGVFYIAPGATATLNRLEITNGKAFNYGGVANYGALTMTACLVSHNVATIGNGGGIENDHGTLTLVDTSIRDNKAGQAGGGINNYFGTVSITNGIIDGNQAVLEGGGILQGGTFTASNVTISNNSSPEGGGLVNYGQATISNSTFSFNEANGPESNFRGNGGGILNILTMNLINCTISGNRATFDGGGIYNFTKQGTITLQNCTVANNVVDINNDGSGEGGGIYNDDSVATLVLSNTIISGNTAGSPNGLDDDFAGNLAELNSSYNIIGVVGTSGLTEANHNQIGPLAAKIRPLANYGGPTFTHSLLTGSLAINAGHPNLGLDDQRGFVVNGIRDIGAYELQDIPFADLNLPNARQLYSYSYQLVPAANTLPGDVTYTFSGTLPPGLSLSPDGKISGVPSFEGKQSFPVVVIASTGDSDTIPFTITAFQPDPLLGFREFGLGSDSGHIVAMLLNPDGSSRFGHVPFPDQSGGIRTSSGDFNGDGIADLVVGTGPGGPTHVKVLDGVSQAVLFSVDPFEASFTGGIFVAAGDINGDGVADLAITPDEGGGPRCRVFTGAGFTQIADFFGIDDKNFRGGARAAIGDLNGDGKADLIVAAGFGGGPRVAAFNGAQLTSTGGPKLFGDFFAFEQALRNGIFVAAGDVNGDGFADLVAGGGPGGGPRVFILDGKSLVQNGSDTLVPLGNFFSGDTNSRGGIRVAIKNLDNDAKADVVTGSGQNSGSRVTAYLGTTITPTGGTPTPTLNFDAFPGFSGGIFLG